jgi:hypothetical protein
MPTFFWYPGEPTGQASFDTVSKGVQTVKITKNGWYRITAAGAKGGGEFGGKGAEVSGMFKLSTTDKISVVVGQQGSEGGDGDRRRRAGHMGPASGYGDDGWPAGDDDDFGDLLSHILDFCPKELSSCQFSRACTNFLEKVVNSKDEPSEKEAAAAGKEALALFYCIEDRMEDDDDQENAVGGGGGGGTFVWKTNDAKTPMLVAGGGGGAGAGNRPLLDGVLTNGIGAPHGAPGHPNAQSAEFSTNGADGVTGSFIAGYGGGWSTSGGTNDGTNFDAMDGNGGYGCGGGTAGSGGGGGGGYSGGGGGKHESSLEESDDDDGGRRERKEIPDGGGNSADLLKDESNLEDTGADGGGGQPIQRAERQEGGGYGRPGMGGGGYRGDDYGHFGFGGFFGGGYDYDYDYDYDDDYGPPSPPQSGPKLPSAGGGGGSWVSCLPFDVSRYRHYGHASGTCISIHLHTHFLDSCCWAYIDC